MRKLPETIQSPAFGFDKPAKERIIEASDKLFRLLGIRVADGLITEDAHSNLDTFRKYFGHGEPLIGRFVKTLIAECEDYWRGLAAEHPNDHEAQLRWWLAFEEDQIGYMTEPRVLLSRTAAELFETRRQQHPLLREIEEYWQAERRRVVGLCKAARLRDPVELADMLLLMVHGARNERGAYGRFAPSRVLRQAGIELISIHRAAAKPATDDAPDLD
ncbi:transcriptional regulator, TetR family [Bradyrhizobium yuanmingense]|uniref:Transcriptional regulator, TetR family n=1 Tax=Bradyrhizobium yuanmingense TaxID=108015 RepID=A0A1C3WTS6_9BRAD|nr:hypothetical protein [Bradyrhizobium yuanmingense]TWI23422.1 TetR family transcriptional regulator [Bradyrhizobium yuanmingense]SCB43315.1 transcriptional regulator, TetR family [Bradyrhizobium yuanmingense]